MTGAAGGDAVRILRAGDSTLIVELDERIDAEVNARAIAIASAVSAAGIAGIRDVVPAFRSVGIYFDPLRTDLPGLMRRVERETREARAPASAVATAPCRIPVCYGGSFGPDLGEVAAFGGLTEAETIRLHTAVTYRVFMLGFLPGFAYMGTVDPRIAMPRRETPRVRVPAGAVAIAGEQTGIYPRETPGGWRIVGRTPLEPFDLGRKAPFLLSPGDRVQFYAIEERDFDRTDMSTARGTH